MRIKKNGKIVCAGDVTPDIMIPYGATLEATSKLKAADPGPPLTPELRPGGSIGNAVATLGILGMRPYFLGAVGSDEYGEYLLNDLESAGVNTEYASKQKERMSLILAVLDKAGERTLYLYDGPGAKYPEPDPSGMPGELIPQTGWFHTNGFANDCIIDYMEKCRQAGAVVSFDLNLRIEDHGFDDSRRARIERAIESSDIILGSGLEEFAPLTGIADLREAAGRLAAGGKIIIARDGVNPMLLFERGECSEIPVRPVKAINTVGSGDVFNGGFIAACVLGRSMRESVVWGSICAASAISSSLPRNIPSRMELERRAGRVLKDIGM